MSKQGNQNGQPSTYGWDCDSSDYATLRVANRLEAGMVAVNQGVGGTGDSPWVGAKHSGYGFHGSPAGHQQFAQVRVLSKR